jgi:hypothetical protein
MFPQRVHAIDATHPASACVGTAFTLSGTAPNQNCFEAIHPDVATNWNYTNSHVYWSIFSVNTVDPYLMQPVAVLAANTWPNQENVPAVSTVVDCSGAQSLLSIRFAHLRTDIGPCISDAEYGVQICSGDGNPASNQNYRDHVSPSSTLPLTAIWKGDTCPAKTT